MRKHPLILRLLLIIFVLLVGTGLSFGTIAINDADMPIVQLQENSLETGMQNIVDSAYITEETQEADKTEEPQESDAAEVTEIPANDAEPTQPTPKRQRVARVTARGGLNVRAGPSAQTERIGALSLHQTAEVLSEENDWLQIRQPDDEAGWIASQHATVFTREAGAVNDSLAGKVIVIDPGHGGSNPGAIGVTGVREKDVVLDVSLRVADDLRAKGANVVLTRDTDVALTLSRRVAIAENSGADVYVSIHANAHPNPQIGGIETYYFRNKATANASFILASQLQRELVSTLNLRDIGVQHGSFWVIRTTSMPSALVELGFLSNSREEALMRTDEFRKNSADAIVRGLINYFQ